MTCSAPGSKGRVQGTQPSWLAASQSRTVNEGFRSLKNNLASQLHSAGSIFAWPKMFPRAVISRFVEGKMSTSSAGKRALPEITCAVMVGMAPGTLRSSRDQAVHCTLKTPLGGTVNCTEEPGAAGASTSGSVHPAAQASCPMIPWLACDSIGTVEASETFTTDPGLPVPTKPGCQPQLAGPVVAGGQASCSAATGSWVPNL